MDIPVNPLTPWFTAEGKKPKILLIQKRIRFQRARTRLVDSIWWRRRPLGEVKKLYHCASSSKSKTSFKPLLTQHTARIKLIYLVSSIGFLIKIKV